MPKQTKTKNRSGYSKSQYVMQYRILDSKRGTPLRKISVHASPIEIQHLAEQGFLVRRKLLSASILKEIRGALSEVLDFENNQDSKLTEGCFGSSYLRHLLEKHPAFLKLFKLKSTLSIAQAVLGPQVKFDEITARVTDLSIQSATTPWHIHLRVVPAPLPAFFAYPHAVECLLYLDDIDEESGPLCVLPGSHRRYGEIYPLNDQTTKEGQYKIMVKAGDGIMIHPNLWHRSLPSLRKPGLRRLIILGYYPSWIYGEERSISRPSSDVLTKLRNNRNPLVRELAGEFFWG